MASGTFPLQVKLTLSDTASKQLVDFNNVLKKVAAPAKAAADRLAALGQQIGVDKLGKALQSVSTSTSRVGKELKGLATDVAWVAGGISAAAAGIFAVVKRSASTGDMMATQAKQVGIATQAWSELSFAADKLDSSSESLHSGLGKLNKNIMKVAAGNREMADAFEYAKVDIYDANHNLKTADQVLVELADKFAAMPDGAKKSALAMKLFGDSAGESLLPMLDAGSAKIEEQRRRAIELGKTWDNEAAAGAGRFNKSFMDLIASIEGVGNAIGKKLFPVLTPCINRITDLVTKFQEWITSSEDADRWIAKIADNVNDCCGKFGEFWETVSKTAKSIDAWVQSIGGWERALSIFAALVVAIKLAPLVTALASLAAAFISLGTAVAGALASIAALLVANPIGLIVATVAAAVYLIISNWETLGPWFASLWESIKGIFGRAWDWIKDHASGPAVVDGILAAFAAIPGHFADIFARIRDAFRVGFLDGLNQILFEFNPLVFIAKAFDAVLKYLTGFSLFEVGKAVIASLWDGLKSKWGEVVAWLAKKIDELTGWMPDFVREKLGLKNMPAPPPPEPGEGGPSPYDQNAGGSSPAPAQSYAKSEHLNAAGALPRASDFLRQEAGGQANAPSQALRIDIFNHTPHEVRVTDSNQGRIDAMVHDDPYTGLRTAGIR